MPITEALKALIKTITGEDATGETIEELIRYLNENYPEGGDSILPAYTSADAGKVLGVDSNGELAWVTPQ